MTITTTAAPGGLEYATPGEVFANVVGGGTVAVDEWRHGDIRNEVDGPDGVAPEGTLLLKIDLDGDLDDGTGNYHHVVSMHPDESDRLALLGRAIQALEVARDALQACGYVDLHERRPQTRKGAA